MKRRILQTIAVQMALVVLLSSTGFASYVHTCKITYKKEISFHSPESCCKIKPAEAGKTTLSKAKCCSIEKSFKKVSTDSFHTFSLTIAHPAAAFLPEFNFDFNPVFFVKKLAGFALYANPPPRFLNKLFISIATFII